VSALRLALALGLAAASSLPGATPPPAAPAATVEQAAPREVHSRTSASSARLGEPLEWAVEIKHAPAERYDFGAPLPEGPYRAEPLGCQRLEASGEAVTTCRLRLALLALGPIDLPTLRLDATTPAGPRVLDVPGPHLTGNGVIDPSVPAEKLELKDLAPPVPLLVPSWRLLWWVLGGLAAVLLGWRLWRWWRARRRAGEAPPPPVPPEVRFAARLDELEGERLGEQGRGREHWFRLSEAVRDYLGSVTGLNALDLTTAELLEALARQPDPRLPLGPLRHFSETADLVKFARLAADARACAEGIGFGRELLARTRPAPPVPAAAPPPATPSATSPSSPPPAPGAAG
jgi:hypothetical protein